MSRIKTWKQLGIFAVLGLLLSWVVSCSTSNVSTVTQQSTSGIGIEFWTMQLQPEFTDYFKKLITIFETENPGIKVNWVDLPWSVMRSKILTAISAKTAPDVVNLNPGFASQLAGRNAWLDLDSKVPVDVRA